MTTRRDDVLVTFDLFSALIDSHTGGAKHFDVLATRRGWATAGGTLFDEWDRRNKASQRDTTEWMTFAQHSQRALRSAYQHFDLDANIEADAAHLLAGMSRWPLWPDVAQGLSTLGTQFQIGILSNVDDDLFHLTRVAPLVNEGTVLTSERLGAYKPAPAIYRSALEHVGGRHLVHVATSARDVRGAIEAAIPVIRLVRPGHVVDPAGPLPTVEATSLDDVAEQLRKML